MAFLRQAGMIFLQMIVIRGVPLHVIRYLPSYYSRSGDTLFPDPADRFLDVGDAD